MHRSSLSFALIHLAVFCGSGVVEADIQCYKCIWISDDDDPQKRHCRDNPSNSDESLSMYPSQFIGTSPTDFQKPKSFPLTRGNIVARANTTANFTTPETTLSNTNASEFESAQEPEVEYTVLCAAMAFSRDYGRLYEQVIRQAYGFRDPQYYNNTCIMSFPPEYNKTWSNELIETITGKILCFCGTNGCNKNTIAIPDCGVKPTFSALAALLSLFLLKYLA